MKIQLQCPFCKFAYSHNPNRKKIGTNYLTIYNTESNISLINDMPAGHSSAVYFTNYKFDLLFESALNAMHDYYYREAIASLTSSLERFFEYCIEILTINLDQDNVEKTWKLVSNQSERQLGAFYFLFLNKFNFLPKFLDTNDISFRNKVIHKGYFPEKEESYNFIKKVYEVVEYNYKIISDNLPIDLELHFEKFKMNLRENCQKICSIEKEKLVKSGFTHYKFCERPFKRNINTYLYNNETFFKRDLNDLETYIEELKTKCID